MLDRLVEALDRRARLVHRRHGAATQLPRLRIRAVDRQGRLGLVPRQVAPAERQVEVGELPVCGDVVLRLDRCQERIPRACKVALAARLQATLEVALPHRAAPGQRLGLLGGGQLRACLAQRRRTDGLELLQALGERPIGQRAFGRAHGLKGGCRRRGRHEGIVVDQSRRGLVEILEFGDRDAQERFEGRQRRASLVDGLEFAQVHLGKHLRVGER